MSQAATPAMALLRLYADDNEDTRFSVTEIALTLQDFAPPAAPFETSNGQPATQFVVIRLPVGWVGEQHPISEATGVVLFNRQLEDYVQHGRNSHDRGRHGARHERCQWQRPPKRGDVRRTGKRGHHSMKRKL